MLNIKFLSIIFLMPFIAVNSSAIPMEQKDTLYRLSQHEVDEINKFYVATDGDNWKINSGWPIESIDRTKQEEPYGLDFLYLDSIIFEDENQVVFEISVVRFDFTGDDSKGNNLSGKLPNLDLQNLRDLFLHRNSLNGEIPNLNLPKLKSILAGYNNFTGRIPDFNATDLSSLELAGNQLTGELPNFNLPRLRYLGVGRNQLTGQIPDFKLLGLKKLNLHNNQFTGEIPDFDLPALEELFVSVNKFSIAALETNAGKYVIYSYKDQDTILPIEYEDRELTVTVDGSANEYHWFLGDTKISSTTISSYRPDEEGIYHCEVTNSLLPDLTLSSHTINVLTVGIATEDEDRNLYYLYNFPPYPQPASSEVKIPIYWRLGNPINPDNIKIYNNMGVEIIQENKIKIEESTSINGEVIWDASGVDSGIYFLEIRHGTSTKYVKILLE
jgi:Secretion system C-terminal sorting domain/Leucine Rich Repeat